MHFHNTRQQNEDKSTNNYFEVVLHNWCRLRNKLLNCACYMASTKSISHDKTCSIDMNLFMVYTCPYPRNKQSNDQIGLNQTTQKQKLSVTSRTFILISRTNWHAHRFDFKHSQNICQHCTIQLTRTLIYTQ